MLAITDGDGVTACPLGAPSRLARLGNGAVTAFRAVN